MIVINNPYRYICVQRLALKGGESLLELILIYRNW